VSPNGPRWTHITEEDLAELAKTLATQIGGGISSVHFDVGPA
jgi:hypothetical protein